MPHPLDTFFAPDSIALIGASRDQEKIPGRLLSMLRKNEFPGKIYPINPNYGDIDGLEMLSRRSPMSGSRSTSPSSSFPRAAVLGALEQCAAAGVRNAVIISSGFAEEGGDSAAMQDAIVELAKRTGMRISGPNAEGFYSEVQTRRRHLQPDRRSQAGHEPRLVATKRRIGIVAQSGGIGFAIYHRAKALGIALSYCHQRRQRIRSRRRRVLRIHGAGCFHRRDPAVHRGHPRRRQISRRRAPRRRDRQARHRDKGRPLRRRRARRRLAYRQHGRLVGGL